MTLTGDPRDGIAKYADCAPDGFDICPENLMSDENADGTVPDCDECEGTPVEKSSADIAERPLPPPM